MSRTCWIWLKVGHSSTFVSMQHQLKVICQFSHLQQGLWESSLAHQEAVVCQNLMLLSDGKVATCLSICKPQCSNRRKWIALFSIICMQGVYSLWSWKYHTCASLLLQLESWEFSSPWNGSCLFCLRMHPPSNVGLPCSCERHCSQFDD